MSTSALMAQLAWMLAVGPAEAERSRISLDYLGLWEPGLRESIENELSAELHGDGLTLSRTELADDAGQTLAVVGFRLLRDESIVVSAYRVGSQEPIEREVEIGESPPEALALELAIVAHELLTVALSRAPPESEEAPPETAEVGESDESEAPPEAKLSSPLWHWLHLAPAFGINTQGVMRVGGELGYLIDLRDWISIGVGGAADFMNPHRGAQWGVASERGADWGPAPVSGFGDEERTVSRSSSASTRGSSPLAALQRRERPDVACCRCWSTPPSPYAGATDRSASRCSELWGRPRSCEASSC